MENNCTENLNIFSHIYTRDQDTEEKLLNKKIPCTFIPDAALTLNGNPINGEKIVKNLFHKENLDLYSKVIVIIINSYMAGLGSDCLARDAFNFIKFSYDLARPQSLM